MNTPIHFSVSFLRLLVPPLLLDVVTVKIQPMSISAGVILTKYRQQEDLEIKFLWLLI